jgi:hypothetical protein
MPRTWFAAIPAAMASCRLPAAVVPAVGPPPPIPPGPRSAVLSTSAAGICAAMLTRSPLLSMPIVGDAAPARSPRRGQ